MSHVWMLMECADAHRMLIGAWNPMVCPICVLRAQGEVELRSSDVAQRTWWRTLFRDAAEHEFPHQLPPGCYYDAEL